MFYYDTLKKFYGERVRLSYTDTDSFVLEMETEDVYEDFRKPELNKYMDFSDYDKNHKSFNDVNKKSFGEI